MNSKRLELICHPAFTAVNLPKYRRNAGEAKTFATCARALPAGHWDASRFFPFPTLPKAQRRLCSTGPSSCHPLPRPPFESPSRSAAEIFSRQSLRRNPGSRS